MLEQANMIMDQAFISFGQELIAFSLIALKFGGLYMLGRLIFCKKKK